MSKAVMDTHSMIFVTIGDLVSPSGSVNGDPLFDFPDHCKPRFSTRFPLCWESEGRTGPPPPNEKSVRSRRPGKAGPSSRGVCCLAPATYETRCLLIGGAWDALPARGFRVCAERLLAGSFFRLQPSC